MLDVNISKILIIKMTIKKFEIKSESTYCGFEDSDFEDKIHYLQKLSWSLERDNYFYAVSYEEGIVVARSIIKKKVLPLGFGSICCIERGPVGVTIEGIMQHLENLVSSFSGGDTILVVASPMMYGHDKVGKVSELFLEAGWTKEKNTHSLYKNTLVIDLNKAIDEIKRGFRRSLKTQINKSDKIGINIDFEPEQSAVDEFIERFNIMANERGINSIGIYDKQFILMENKAGLTQIILAYLGNDMIGGLVLVAQGERVIYEWGMVSSEKQYKSLPLAHKLHWEAIKWAKKNGYRYYDFGGYWVERGIKDPINYFKLGFTKNVEVVTPEFFYTLKPFRNNFFSILNKIRKYFQ